MQLTLPTQLTLGRVVIVPIICITFYIPGFWGYLLSTLLFVIASITDWLDGHLARTRGEETAFGRFLDPVADKLLVATVLVLLVGEQRVPAVLAAIIIGREIAIGALREWLAERSAKVHVSGMGKVKTGFQMTAIGMLLMHINLFGLLDLHMAGTVLLWIAATLTLWSGWEYVSGAWPELKRPHSDKR